jgi:hypothetical protein
LHHRKKGKGNNLVEVCEHNWPEMLNGKHGQVKRGTFNCINPSRKKIVVDYALTAKFVLQNVMDLKTGSENVQNLVSLTLLF